LLGKINAFLAKILRIKINFNAIVPKFNYI
jgi:hypothetical protein